MPDSMEQRLDRLERAVETLKTSISSQPNLIAEITGISKDDSDFDEIVRIGKEIRNAEPPDQD